MNNTARYLPASVCPILDPYNLFNLHPIPLLAIAVLKPPPRLQPMPNASGSAAAAQGRSAARARGPGLNRPLLLLAAGRLDARVRCPSGVRWTTQRGNACE